MGQEGVVGRERRTGTIAGREAAVFRAAINLAEDRRRLSYMAPDTADTPVPSTAPYRAPRTVPAAGVWRKVAAVARANAYFTSACTRINIIYLYDPIGQNPSFSKVIVRRRRYTVFISYPVYIFASIGRKLLLLLLSLLSSYRTIRNNGGFDNFFF